MDWVGSMGPVAVAVADPRAEVSSTVRAAHCRSRSPVGR